MANFRNKKPRGSGGRGGCFCGGKFDKKVTGRDKEKYTDPPEEPRKSRGKKDRKKWCGGKTGIEHKYRWVIDNRFESWRRDDDEYVYQNYECAKCGRITNWGSLHKKCGKMHSRWRLSADDPCEAVA